MKFLERLGHFDQVADPYLPLRQNISPQSAAVLQGHHESLSSETFQVVAWVAKPNACGVLEGLGS